MYQSDLKKLLNDESFIRWLRDEASNQGKRKWDRWLGERHERYAIVQKAKKIVTMPFTEKTPPDVERELQVLQAEIAKKEKN
jgi:hypothetical protein